MSIQQLPSTIAPAIVPSNLAMSDDECVKKLALLIEHKDSKDLSEIAALISRLAVGIE